MINDPNQLSEVIGRLTTIQRDWLVGVLKQFEAGQTFVRNEQSDWITQDVLDRLGMALLIHHAFSRQTLSKDRFEFALERALNLAGIKAELATSRTNRGHDITIAGVSVSLKTESAANIKRESIHISKWMELGKGEWKLPRLRDLFIEHMNSYKRIFTLRSWKPTQTSFYYELVEIPKALLLESKGCRFEVKEDSRQTPKPGYGYVEDSRGNLKFALYFDGGSERKLQIKHIKKSHCIVHATWQFDSATL